MSVDNAARSYWKVKFGTSKLDIYVYYNDREESSKDSLLLQQEVIKTLYGF